MFSLLKPYFGPAALIAFERGLDGMGVQISPFWSGALLAFAAFWIMLALTSHKALVTSFPGIRAWLPFVDPAGSVKASSDELSARYITQKSFHLYQVAFENNISDRTFEDCDIYGPAVIFMSGVGHVHECGFVGPKEGLYISAKQSIVVGPIHAINCSFRKCRFYGIGFIGRDEDKQMFLDELREQST